MPLLALLALVLLVSAVTFALSTHDLPGAVVGLIVALFVVDALAFGVLAWASATPGPTWRPATVILAAINLVATLLDQVGLVDVIVIVLLVLAAVAALATPRSVRGDVLD